MAKQQNSLGKNPNTAWPPVSYSKSQQCPDIGPFVLAEGKEHQQKKRIRKKRPFKEWGKNNV